MDGNLKKALKNYEKQKARAQERGDLEEEAKVCSVIGELFAQHDLYENAIKEHKQALKMWDARQEPMGCAVAHRMIGECLCSLGKYKEALFHQNLHLQLAKSSSDTVEQQRAWATIGRTWFVYSDSAVDAIQREECQIEAQKAYLESLSLCDKLQGAIPDTELLEMRARLYLNLGLVYDSKSDTSSARKFINQALNIAREQNLAETEFRCLYCIGGVLAKVGLDSQATNAFEKAVLTARKSGHKYDEADALVQLGIVNLKLGEFMSARRILKKAYKISQSKVDNEIEGLKPNLVAAIKGLKLINKLNNLPECKENEQVKVLDALGDLYSNMKAFKKALECYNKELELAKTLGLTASKLSPIFVSLAMTYSDLGLPDNAVQCYMEELSIIEGNYKGMCDTWCNVALVYETSDYGYSDVEQAYLSALKYAEKANKVSIQIRVHKCLADAQKKYDKMLLHQQTMKTIEKLESEFGIDEESDEEEMEEEGAQAEESEDDDDVLINREMEVPDSDDDDNEDSDHESTVRRRNRAARVKLSKVNEKGETPLHRAAIAGDARLVGTLVDQGADINARDYCGWQPLHEACNHGNVETVKVLLAKGAKVNDPGGAHCQGVTPLHDAAQNGHVDIVKVLIEHGASLLNKDTQGHTPLDLVVIARETEDEGDEDDGESGVAAGRRQVEKYLKRFAAGKSLDSNTIVATEMKRRNRLFIEDNDTDNKENDDVKDDDDDDDDLGIPSLSHFKQRLQKREYKRTKIRASIDSDDEDSPAELIPSQDQPHRSLHPSDQLETDKDSRKRSLNEEDNVSLDYDSHNSTAHQQGKSDLARSTHGATDSGHCSSSSIPHSRVLLSNSSNCFVDPIQGRHGESSNTQAQPALISERELEYESGVQGVGETDWLIDDMPSRPLKRRRTTPKQVTLGKSLQLSRKRPTAYTNKPSRSKTITRTSKQPRLQTTRTPSPTFLSSSPDASVSYHDNELSITAPRQSRSSTDLEMSSRQSNALPASTATTPPMRVKVQIKETTFLIPCPSSGSGDRKTIAWLAEQAKLRYFTAYGLRPVIVLQTNEGAYLSPEDYISDVLSNNEQIVGSLESWDLPPLAERYNTACLANTCKVRNDVLTLLQADPQISVVSLGNLALRSSDVLPLARALQCHDRLVKLILPGNRIGDPGLQHIAGSLHTLPNLAVLDLRCNGLTHKGITHLAHSISKSSDQQEIAAPLKLEELNLSFNALTDTCASSLAAVIAACPHLNTLQLQSVCISGKVLDQGKPLGQAFKASRFRHFSISHNAIGAQGIQELLLVLPCDVTHHLDISSTGLVRSTVAMATKSVIDYMNKEQCALQALLMADCCLSSKEVVGLTSTRCFQSGLRSLDVSCNIIGNDTDNCLSKVVGSGTLTSLSLQGNSAVNMETLESILQSLVSNSNSVLSNLNFSNCGLTSPVTDNVISLLEQPCLPLVQVDLSFCSIEVRDFERIVDSWRRHGNKEAITKGRCLLLCSSQN